MKKYFPLICGLIAAVIFGFAMFFIKTGMRVVNYNTVKFLAFRFVLGFLVLALLRALKLQKADYKSKPVWLLVFCGALNPLISQVLETTSTTYAPTAQIAVLTSVIPVFVVLLSIPVNREWPAGKQVFFMLLSIVGVLIINLAAGQMRGGTVLGLILIFATIAVLSLQRVFIRKASRHFTPFETIYISTGMGALGFSLIAIADHWLRGGETGFFNGLWVPEFVIPILYMGIVSCVIAFLCLTYASGNLPIAVSGSIGTLSTVVSVLVGVFIFKEQLRLIDVIGTVVILGSILGMSLSYNARDPAGNRLKS
jgi:drug/metabolite transporter (DMT)-like permease